MGENVENRASPFSDVGNLHRIYVKGRKSLKFMLDVMEGRRGAHIIPI